MYVLIDNYDSFTYNIYQELCELTAEEIRVLRNDAVTIDEIADMRPRGIILSPGPGRPEEAGIIVELIRRFAGEVPVLGVCLGHQAVAAAFGGRIVRALRIVHGKKEAIQLDGKGLFRGIPREAVFTRYHSLIVDEESLPPELEVTARSVDGEIMGLRHRSLQIEGVQFHPESVSSEYGRKVLANFITYKRQPADIHSLLEKVLDGQDLSIDEAHDFMDELTEGNLSEPHIAAFLIGLSMKGIVPEEIVGCASTLREKQRSVELTVPSMDTCGTGGDGLHTFNISSLTALTAAACGVTVAKHGNRAVSSRSGSADFYSQLGIPIDLAPAQTAELIEKTGFGFLFAPIFHGAMRHAAPVRRQLGVKTIMNLLGPLVNPARAEYQLLGVYDPRYCLTMAKSAKMLGCRRVMVVHGRDGEDEISVTSPTRVVMIDENNAMQDFEFDPHSLGIPEFSIGDLAGGSPEENARTAEAMISGGGPSALREAVAVNSGAALYLYGLCDSIAEGYLLASDALSSGKVQTKLHEIRMTGSELARARTATSAAQPTAGPVRAKPVNTHPVGAA